MRSIVKVFDPEMTRRQLSFVITEDTAPGFIEFLASLPYRSEANLIRTVLYEWFHSEKEAGTLDETVASILGLDPKQQVRSARRAAPRSPRKTVQRMAGRTDAVSTAGRPAGERQSIQHRAGNLPSASVEQIHAPSQPTVHVTSPSPSSSFPDTSLAVSNSSVQDDVAQDEDDAMERLKFLDTLP